MRRGGQAERAPFPLSQRRRPRTLGLHSLLPPHEDLMSPVFSPACAPSSIVSAARGRGASRLGLLSAVVAGVTGLTGCYAHHTADEDVLEPSAYSNDDDDTDTGTDGGTASADGAAADPCANIDDGDVLGQIVCDFTTGGASGSLGTPSGSQCDSVSPDDFATLALCAAGGGTGSQNGGIDLAGLLSLAGSLAGGGQTGTGNNAGGLGDLLGLLGGLGGQTGGQAGTGTNANGLGSLLGLLGGLGGQTGGQAGTGNNAGGLGSLLGLLGGLGGQTGQTNTNNTNGTR
jgi:hypothetical protein